MWTDYIGPSNSSLTVQKVMSGFVDSNNRSILREPINQLKYGHSAFGSEQL